MKISLDWVKEYIQLTKSPNEIADALTQSGLEVEGIEKFETIKGGLEGLVIGEVKTCSKHPDADKLKVTSVDIGNGAPRPIVCGAPNVDVGQKVVIATVGTTLYPEGHEPFTIKKAKIRGEVSEGMICAEDEIGLGAGHDGIMVLNTDLPNGTPAAKYFDVSTDSVLEIGLTPNRADATSHIGVARELKVLFKSPIKKPTLNLPSKEADLPIAISIENTEACPRYAGITIDNIKVEPSPQWLSNRLKAIGLTPINNVVDITNFVLHEYGQPLHAFDYSKIKTQKVVVKTLPQNTPFKTLDGTERKLQAHDLMICDGDSPMCIAGIFGGADSGVSEKTTSIFLESAYFSPDYIRKSAQTHALKTDASFRFERGVDPDATIDALKRAASLICEIAGGKIAGEIQDFYPEPISGFDIELKFKNVDRIIGISIDRDVITNILEQLEIQIVKKDENALTLKVPPYRVDVQREADVIEEILRIYGYENIDISHQLSTGYIASFPVKDIEKTTRLIAETLVSSGYNEIITNSLTKSSYSDLVDEIDSSRNVNILNKLSEDLGVMRQTLLFNGLEVVAHNVNRRQKNVKLYEFGKTYEKGENKYVEKNHLALFITGNKSDESWRSHDREVNLHDLSEHLGQVFTKLNIHNVQITNLKSSIFSQGYDCIYNNKSIATFGIVSKKLSKACDLQQQTLAAFVDIKALHKYYSSEISFELISKFPEVRRDLSLVIDKSITFDQIKAVAHKNGNRLIKDINAFDTYEGESLGDGKKSYSISFILHDVEKTLTDKVIDKTMNKLISAFEREIDALIRK